MKHLLFFFFLFVGIGVSTLAVPSKEELGLPYFESFSFSKIGYDGLYFGIAQDEESVLYFENEYGVVEYDGVRFSFLPTKNNGRSILECDEKGTVYVGALNFLGKICCEGFSTKEIRSVLTDSLKSFTFGEVSDIEKYKDTLYFVADGSLYKVIKDIPHKVSIKNDYINNKRINKIIKDRDRLFISTDSMLFVNPDNPKPCYNSKIQVFDAVRSGETLLFLTQNGFMKMMPDSTLAYVKSDIDSLFSKDTPKFFKLRKTTHDNVCVGTKEHGLFILNSEGKLLQSITRKNGGLIDDRINGMFVDNANNVWVTTGYGVCRIELDVAITYFSRQNGLVGTVQSVIRYQNALYVGTDRGLFVKTGEYFNKLTSKSCSSLVAFAGHAIAGLEDGLYAVNVETNKKMHLLKEEVKVVAPFNKSRLIVVTSDSVYLMDKDFKLVKLADIPNISITTIGIDTTTKKETILFGTKSGILWMLQKNSNSKWEFTKCDWDGLPRKAGSKVDVYTTTSGIILSASDGLYRCDIKNKFFFKDRKIIIPTQFDNVRVTSLVEDKDNNLWLSFHNNGSPITQIAVAWNTNNMERYTLITAPFSKVRQFRTTVICPDEKSVIWFGGYEGIVRLDFNSLAVRKTIGDVRISQIVVDGDSLMLMKDLIVPYNKKTILFEFAAVEFENHEDLYYQYYLEGFDKEWYPMTKFEKKTYTNLPSGHYVFHIKAMRHNGITSRETVFAFDVERHPLMTAWAFLCYLVLFVILIFVVRYLLTKVNKRSLVVLNKVVAPKNKKLKKEKDKVEIASADIHSEEITRVLPNIKFQKPKRFNLVTILFSDFKGFSQIAENISTDNSLYGLDKYHKEFDRIVSRYKIEKIKTVENSFMCAGGIPKKNITNPLEVVAVALEMQHFMTIMQKNNPDEKKEMGIRIGIHTGNVQVGVVGSKKYSYDIWGDSVNVANRMETAGVVGRINISESTYVLVHDVFDCEYRGKLSVKGRTERLDMYFVNGLKPDFSDKKLKITPNDKFMHRIAELKLMSLSDQMYDWYEKNLSANYLYHSIRHMIDVVVQTEIIGRAEGIIGEDLYLLETAALFHDAGLVNVYENHEPASVEIAKEVLENEGYTQEQISRVCSLILSTSLKEKPNGILECILRDADLDYLGRDDYFSVSRDFYEECLSLKIMEKNEYKWIEGQILFLQGHVYYTNYSKMMRNELKVAHIQQLQTQLIKYKNINI